MDKKQLLLTIVTPEKTVLSDKPVESVTIPAFGGEMGYCWPPFSVVQYGTVWTAAWGDLAVLKLHQVHGTSAGAGQIREPQPEVDENARQA